MREVGEASCLDLLRSFSCNLNPDVEQFLTQRSKAIQFEKTDNARTYLVVDDETTNILGYFAVSFKELTLENADLSKSRVKRLDGINKNAERIRAFLIGQLGKNTAVEDNPIKLANLLAEAYAIIIAAKALVGGRVIILECEDKPKLIELYEKEGFALIDLNGDSQLPRLRTMYIHIAE